MNLQAYLHRIGYDKPVAPTLEVLRAIVYHQATAIAFENLNPLLGLPVSLAPADLERKLVVERRGGYCFEHNLLLAQALQTMGFAVSGLAARVLWTRQEDEITARSHMLLRVDLDACTYLVDVGFGGLTLTGVLALQADVVQDTPHEPFRLLRRDGDWWMQAKVRGDWATLYRFDLQRQHPIDYEACNYYLSTHPSSHFVTGLVAARPVADGRYALRNRELAFHACSGASERRTLASVDEVLAVLENKLGLQLPQIPQLQTRLAALFAD